MSTNRPQPCFLQSPKHTSRVDRHLSRLSRTQLQDFARQVYDVLYLDNEGEFWLYNPDKEWEVNTIEWVAAAIPSHLRIRP